MRVPFLNLKELHGEYKNELIDQISSVLDGGDYILGEAVTKFESNWSEYTGAKYCVGVGSGLDALTLSLKALDIGYMDEVIVPAHTFIATWLAVSLVGATPMAVDVDSESKNICLESILKHVTPSTKAIIIVHLYGQPAQIDEINKFAKANNIRVIEDAAQAHGAIYRDKKIGAHSDAVCWSFYPGKNLGAIGDAGGVTSNNHELIKKIRLLRNYGSEEKYIHEILGHNTRLDSLQAAVLNTKIKYLDKWNENRRKIARRYLSQIDNIFIEKPVVKEGSIPSWHLFTIQVSNRKKFSDYLEKNHIKTLIHYPILPLEQNCYRYLHLNPDDYPISKKITREVISLPLDPYMSEEQTNYVIDIVNQYDWKDYSSA